MSKAVEGETERGATSTRGLKLALGGYILLLALQVVTYFITNVLALLAIAFETLASAIIAALLLLAARISRRPADELHMFGYGRAQNVAAVVAGTVFISLLSLETFRQAIPRFFQAPSTTQYQNITVALIVTAVSLLVCLVPVVDILRQKTRGPSLKAQLISSLEDVIAYSAALVSSVLVSRGYHLADPIASVIIGVLIALGGIYLFRDNVPYLLGKAPGRELIDKVESAVTSVDGVLGMHNFRAEYVEHNVIHTGFHVEVDSDISVQEADRILQDIKDKVEDVTGCRHCVIQIDPAARKSSLPGMG